MRQVAKCECARWPNSLRPNTNLNIEVFGNDRDSCYSSFANSIFHLFHNRAYFENKNILTEDVFPGKKMDIIISNSPFGAISKSDYEVIKGKVS